jgi:mRNA interferase MazF
MGAFTAGPVVIVRFPFSDLSASKFRPAVVLADAGRGDWILCQITSKSYGDSNAIELNGADFASGSLQLSSYVRPGKLFTAHASLIVGQAGVLRTDKLSSIRGAVVRMIQNSNSA